MTPPVLQYRDNADRLPLVIDGFQLLHAVYIVETFLGNLIKRGCNFHLVFFEGMQLACTCSPGIAA